MAMGLHNASPFFQGFMNRNLADCRYRDATPFQDDVNIANESANEHVKGVDNVFGTIGGSRDEAEIVQVPFWPSHGKTFGLQGKRWSIFHERRAPG